MNKRQRVIFTVLLVVMLGGLAAYQTIRRNNLDYQMHPVASVLGSIIPSIVLSPVAYWISGRSGRKKQNK